MRGTYWYHEECIPRTGARTSSSEMHDLCVACGKEGECVEVEINTNPDVRKTENWTMQPVEVTEGDSKPIPTHTGEVAESIPVETIEKAVASVSTYHDPENELEAESVEEDKAEEVTVPQEEEPAEEAAEAEPPSEPVSEPSVTIEVEVDAEKAKATLNELEAQIAALQAKKDALKEEE